MLDELASAVAARKFNRADANTEGEFFFRQAGSSIGGWCRFSGADFSAETLCRQRDLRSSETVVRILLERADANAPAAAPCKQQLYSHDRVVKLLLRSSE